MKWVTRSHVHVDRVACPWLITRFVDSDAEFIYVPRSQVQEVAEREGAIPFDAPGVELGHRKGQDGSSQCSFETIIEVYGLSDPGLLRLAEIVHGADVADDRYDDPIAKSSGHGTHLPSWPLSLCRLLTWKWPWNKLKSLKIILIFTDICLTV